MEHAVVHGAAGAGETWMQLEPLPYHVLVAARLEAAEPELWAWFCSDTFAEKYKAATADDLLRNAIRLDRSGPNERRYQLAEQARDKLGLAEPITLHQMHDATGRPNAFLIFMPGEIVIAFEGRILELLDQDGELLDLLGHEISHYKLYTEAAGRYRVADRLLGWLIAREQCPPEFIETWRRNRLFTEIYCDLGGLMACGDRDATIRGLVKSLADFKDADAASYLRQAEELLARGAGVSRGTTHPELHVRVLAVANAETMPPSAFSDMLAQLIAGPLDVAALDLPDQQRLADLTRALLDRFLSHHDLSTDQTMAYARQMFPDYAPPSAASGALTTISATLSESTIDYLSYVLLDLATIDDSGSSQPIAVAAAIADELGLASRFREIARQELKGRRAILSGLTTRAA